MLAQKCAIFLPVAALAVIWTPVWSAVTGSVGYCSPTVGDRNCTEATDAHDLIGYPKGGKVNTGQTCYAFRPKVLVSKICENEGCIGKGKCADINSGDGSCIYFTNPADAPIKCLVTASGQIDLE
ncbi:hypothetical protein BDZ90DRAFT_67084 [Jaminaea rosea]|uniref:Uncharacterized protein n=1 Tax=Jaminaea rosea TaxID=1569628 RepID=A0A316UJP4_9BASI|nr:hypothetical protein BDZ90DRAFT_67084 [Jaminaea rosea]PWN25507.1 hypothetical protein BDZ90DRAFT_67084 [Jaminaea rosea]